MVSSAAGPAVSAARLLRCRRIIALCAVACVQPTEAAGMGAGGREGGGGGGGADQRVGSDVTSNRIDSAMGSGSS